MCLTCTSKTSPGKYSMVCFLVDTIIFSFPCQNPPFFASIWQQHWWSTDNFGFDNSTDDWQGKYFHCSLNNVHWSHCVYNTVELSSYTCNCILFSWTCIIRPNTTISHGCYAGVQFIPATSLVRFDPWVTAIDRFHCTMVTPWRQKEPCVHIMAASGK